MMDEPTGEAGCRLPACPNPMNVRTPQAIISSMIAIVAGAPMGMRLNETRFPATSPV